MGNGKRCWRLAIISHYDDYNDNLVCNANRSHSDGISQTRWKLNSCTERFGTMRRTWREYLPTTIWRQKLYRHMNAIYPIVDKTMFRSSTTAFIPLATIHNEVAHCRWCQKAVSLEFCPWLACIILIKFNSVLSPAFRNPQLINVMENAENHVYLFGNWSPSTAIERQYILCTT